MICSGVRMVHMPRIDCRKVFLDDNNDIMRYDLWKDLAPGFGLHFHVQKPDKGLVKESKGGWLSNVKRLETEKKQYCKREVYQRPSIHCSGSRPKCLQETEIIILTMRRPRPCLDMPV